MSELGKLFVPTTVDLIQMLATTQGKTWMGEMEKLGTRAGGKHPPKLV